MKPRFTLGCLGGAWLCVVVPALAQNSPSPQAAPAATAPTASPTSAAPPTVYRDPHTGQLYQQEFQTVDQPVTTWQRRYVDRTVVTPQTVIENQQVPQTTFVAKTEYVLQSKVKGLWNPFAQPTYAYEYVPVTRWVPQTQMVTRQVPTVKMLASTEKVPVDEPVQTTQKVTQVVTRPLPASAATNTIAANQPSSPPPVYLNTYPAGPSQAYFRPTTVAQAPAWRPTPTAYNTFGYANNAQPLVASVPILGRQPTQTAQPGALLQAPINGLRQVVRATTAPFSGQSSYGSYVQPMNVASNPNANWGRDISQSGLPPTVVRSEKQLAVQSWQLAAFV